MRHTGLEVLGATVRPEAGVPATGSGPKLSASEGVWRGQAPGSVWPVHREVDGCGAGASQEGGRASDKLTCRVSRSSCASSAFFSSSRRLRSASSSSTFNLQGEQTMTGGPLQHGLWAGNKEGSRRG